MHTDNPVWGVARFPPARPYRHAPPVPPPLDSLPGFLFASVLIGAVSGLCVLAFTRHECVVVQVRRASAS